VQTPKRPSTGFDMLSSSLTASTAASRSKMNRTVSTCNIAEHYDSFTSLNSKATMPIVRTTRPAALFGGSLINIHSTPARSISFVDDRFDLGVTSPLTGSLSSLTLSMPAAGKTNYRLDTNTMTMFDKVRVLRKVKHIYRRNRTNNRHSTH
jgi:hypothetical protein